MSNQNLFEAIERTFGVSATEDEMSEIINAIKQDEAAVQASGGFGKKLCKCNKPRVYYCLRTGGNRCRKCGTLL